MVDRLREERWTDGLKERGREGEQTECGGGWVDTAVETERGWEGGQTEEGWVDRQTEG